MTQRLIIFFFIMVVVIGIGIAIYNSGVLGRTASFLNSFGSASSTPTPAYSFTPLPSGAGSTGGAGGGYAGGAGGYAPTPTPIPANEIPPGMTLRELSPYFHQVRFGGLTPGGAYSYGQISLYVYLNNPSSTVDVTGWKIEANHGGEYIPQAVNLYDPSGLTPASDIVMKSGDQLYLYSSSAPVNLRLNECIGYLPNRSQFTPQLPQTCPSINYSSLSSFSGACQMYIESLGGCTEPNMASPSIPQNDYSCINYLENHFNYHSCYAEHAGDANFLSNQVWAFMGSSPLDQFHDKVKLLDRNGLVVDVYSY